MLTNSGLGNQTDVPPAISKHIAISRDLPNISDVGLYSRAPDEKIAVRGAVAFNRRLTDRVDRIILGFQRQGFAGGGIS